VATKASSQVDAGSSIRLVGKPARFVSRGGLKLEGALESFGIDVAGRSAVDLGASTGGFTDCLLQRGASTVAAVDVGYGQLAWRIRNDPRVTVFERLNVRHMDPAVVGAPFSIVVADLSFISLCTVASVAVAVGADDADWILLVKPQFEAGKEQVGKGGIVRDVDVRRETVATVADCYAVLGLGARGVVDSPIKGGKGNREFLLWLRRGPGEISSSEWTALEGLQDA